MSIYQVLNTLCHMTAWPVTANNRPNDITHQWIQIINEKGYCALHKYIQLLLLLKLNTQLCFIVLLYLFSIL